jgi:hypothetical protein
MTYIVAIVAMLKDEPELSVILCMIGLIEVGIWAALAGGLS